MSGPLVADTHAAIWFLEGSSRLSATARGAMEAALANGEPIFISAITLGEMVYLVEKGRIPQSAWDDLLDELRRPDSGFVAAPFTLEMAETMAQIPSRLVPDMPDRMIAATALNLGHPLVTRDSQIRSAGLTTIW